MALAALVLALGPTGLVGRGAASTYIPAAGWSTGTRIEPLDSTPPVTTPIVDGALGANGWHNSQVVVTLIATDDTGVNFTEFRVDGAGFQRYRFPFPVTDEGLHTVEFYSQDLAGNPEDVKTLGIAIDSEPPVATASLEGLLDPSTWYRSTVTVTLTAMDVTSGMASIEYRVDGGGWEPYSVAFTIGEGRHTLEVRATDVAGLIDDRSMALSVDPTAPSCAAFTGGLPGDNGWWRSDVVLTLSCSDGTSGLASVEYRVDGGDWNLYPSPTSLELTDGLHVVGYRAVDEAGNVATEGTVDAPVDREPPMVTVTEPAPGTWINTSAVVIRWNATDATSGAERFEVSVDGGSPQVVGEPEIRLDGLTDGSHTVTVRAIDAAGNVGSTTATLGVDTQPPTILASPGQGAVVTARQVDVRVDAIDDASGSALCHVRLDEGEPRPVPPGGSTAFDGLADGPHVVSIACEDFAGNVGVARHAFTVVTDPLSPSGPYGPWPLVGLTALPTAVAAAVALRVRRRRTAEGPRHEDEPEEADAGPP